MCSTKRGKGHSTQFVKMLRIDRTTSEQSRHCTDFPHAILAIWTTLTTDG
jgi:hypothetical protein